MSLQRPSRRRLRRSSAIAAAATVAVVAASTAASAGAAANGSIAFTSFEPDRAVVLAVDPAGGEARLLTTAAPPVLEAMPAYSADGGRVAHTCGSFGLCVMNADGGEQRLLTTTRWPQR